MSKIIAIPAIPGILCFIFCFASSSLFAQNCPDPAFSFLLEELGQAEWELTIYYGTENCQVAQTDSISFTYHFESLLIDPNAPFSVFSEEGWFDPDQTCQSNYEASTNNRSLTINLLRDSAIGGNGFLCRVRGSGVVLDDVVARKKQLRLDLLYNQSSNVLYVSHDENPILLMKIISPAGKVYQQQTLPTGTTRYKVPLHGLPGGLYFIQFFSEEGIYVKAILIP